MKRLALGCLAALAALPLSAAVHEFAPTDKIQIRSEPKGYESLVVVSQETGRVVFDCRAAFAKGMQNLVCELPAFEDPALAGDDVLFEALAGSLDVQGQVRIYVQMWKELDGRRLFHVLKTKNPFVTVGRGGALTRCVGADALPAKSGGYRLRFDFNKPSGKGGIYCFAGGRVARMADVRVSVTPKKVKPELTMYLPFDGTAKAAVARGRAEPLAASGVTYAPGLKGSAARISRADKTFLEYAFTSNVSQVRGSISMWVKRDDWQAGGGRGREWLFTTPTPFDLRMGTGALYLWFWEPHRVRLDTSDDCDAFVYNTVLLDGEWHHIVSTWNEAGGSLFVDGAPCYDDVGGSTFISPLARARQPYGFRRRGDLDAARSFFVGSWRGTGQFNGLIDEVKIYSAALTRDEARALYREGGVPAKPRPDYAALSAARGGNPYEGPERGPGGAPGEMELVREVRFDEAGLAALRRPGVKFEVVGPSAVRRTADGTGYVELGGTPFHRMAVGFELTEGEPLYVFEIDYPDDAKRTMDFIVQDAFSPFYETKLLQDYEMQVGIFTGGDYPLSGKVRTHRCIYWASTTNVVFEAMTLRQDEPAAVAAVRLYRLKGRTLPKAKIRTPKPKAGWGRSMGWYYEDPSINYEFAVKDYAATPELCLEMVDKIAATMKYQGLDLFAYPGSWYDGYISDSYNVHGHAPDFLRAFYERFDKEGLGVVPLINQENHPVPPGSLTYDMITSGEVHSTMYNVTATGLPDCGIVRKPSLFNICHPDAQRYLEGMIDLFVAEGVKHPSFRGVGLHVKHASLCWLGLITSGYNDYMIDGFTRDTGIKVPVDRRDPKRGKAYADWLLANAYEPWVQWRCRQVSGFWVKIARKLAAARPDLKLWINNIADLDPIMDRFSSPDYMRRIAREGGLDRDIFAREAPNVIMSQTCLPADYRYARPGWYYATEADFECQRTYHTKPYYWDFLEGAAYPLVHLHDRYWESHAGDVNRNKDPALRFKSTWFKEVKWRVTTLNAPGPYAMEHYAVPMRFRDILGFTKGGYLVGTYGMEEHLVPFAQAFRALPAVNMETLPGGGEFVRLRHVDYDGRSWFYVVNTGVEPACVRVRFPEGSKDLVSDASCGGDSTINLGPYELRSFCAPSGRPALLGTK